MECAGYLKSGLIQFIDHITPLCSLLGIPLIVTSQEDLEICKAYYPDTKVILHDNQLTVFSFLAKNFNTLIECSTSKSLNGVFFEFFHNKKMNLISCPHGISDKHLEKDIVIYIEPSKKHIIIYGEKTKKAVQQMYHVCKNPNWLISGNYRKLYYEKNLTFYKKIVEKKLLKKLDKNNKTIFYAPTWSSLEINSSFSRLSELLIDNLPEKYNLIIKPHPLLKRNHPGLYYKIKQTEKKNCVVLNEIPIIHPLIDYADIYLGDFSSIGYNVITFKKPMFFFDPDDNTDKNLLRYQLYKCGITIPHSEINSIYEFIDKNLPFPKRLLNKQKQLGDQIFDPIDFSAFKEKIFSISDPVSVF